jgi:hypothetical protein
VLELPLDQGSCVGDPGLIAMGDCHDLHGVADRCQRIAQLMRQGGEKFILAPIRGERCLLGFAQRTLDKLATRDFAIQLMNFLIQRDECRTPISRRHQAQHHRARARGLA